MSRARPKAKSSFSLASISDFACSIWLARNWLDWPIRRTRDSTFQSMYASATAFGMAAASSGEGATAEISTRLVPRRMVTSRSLCTPIAASTKSRSAGLGTLPFASGRNSAKCFGLNCGSASRFSLRTHALRDLPALHEPDLARQKLRGRPAVSGAGGERHGLRRLPLHVDDGPAPCTSVSSGRWRARRRPARRRGRRR